jgi:short-subunit dehydrogenase
VDQNIIISGASGNLGQDVVKKLSDLNYRLYVTTGPRRGDLFGAFPNVDAQPVDLLDKQASEAFVHETITKTKKIQAGIFLVGGYAPGDIGQTNDSDIEKMMQLNFFTAFHLVKPLVTHFKKNGGGQLIFIGAKPAIIAKNGAGNLRMLYPSPCFSKWQR